MRGYSPALGAVFVIASAGVSACGGATQPTPESALRVGTIGDSPPFSLQTRTGFVGIDIDLARDLGRHLGRPVEFVQTTWTHLLRDARQGQFDLAMSAINILPDRLTFVDFSQPYAEQRYGVIVRCEDRNRFATLAEVDQPDVTIFAKRGTAQAIFALRNLPRARTRQLEDAGEVYDQLAEGAGDAVVGRPAHIRGRTDLCLGLDGATIWTVPIAVLLPPGSSLTSEVNRWLGQRMEDGTVRSLLRHYGLGPEPSASPDGPGSSEGAAPSRPL